jgi:Flp pilus assembly protein TadG
MKRSRGSGGRRGSAIVEMAVSMPLLLLFFTSCFQFGDYYYLYNRLESAVRAGARYASLRAYDSSTSTPASDFTTAVRNMVVYASPATGTQAVVPGLSTGNVNLAVTMSNDVPSQMSVSISGYQINGVFGTWTLSNKPVAVFRYQGKLAPGS